MIDYHFNDGATQKSGFSAFTSVSKINKKKNRKMKKLENLGFSERNNDVISEVQSCYDQNYEYNENDDANDGKSAYGLEDGELPESRKIDPLSAALAEMDPTELMHMNAADISAKLGLGYKGSKKTKTISNLNEEMEAVKLRHKMNEEDKDDIDADRRVERDIENLKLCRKEEIAFGGDVVALNQGRDEKLERHSKYLPLDNDSQELSDDFSDEDEFRSLSEDSDDFEDGDFTGRSRGRSGLGRNNSIKKNSKALSYASSRKDSEDLDKFSETSTLRGRTRSRDSLDFDPKPSSSARSRASDLGSNLSGSLVGLNSSSKYKKAPRGVDRSSSRSRINLTEDIIEEKEDEELENDDSINRWISGMNRKRDSSRDNESILGGRKSSLKQNSNSSILSPSRSVKDEDVGSSSGYKYRTRRPPSLTRNVEEINVSQGYKNPYLDDDEDDDLRSNYSVSRGRAGRKQENDDDDLRSNYSISRGRKGAKKDDDLGSVYSFSSKSGRRRNG